MAIFITSARRLSFHRYLSVCLSPGYHKKYSTDFHERLWKGTRQKTNDQSMH